VLKKLFDKTKEPATDYKTIAFFKFAQTIGAVDSMTLENIDIDTLILSSFLFLIKDTIVTHKQKEEYLIFKDRYNRYLEYCIDNKLVKKEQYLKVDRLFVATIPDMSHIKIPDIKKELEEMDFDLDKITEVFSKLK
jgi:hypothetical protein